MLEAEKSYSRILKSSSIMGGAQGFNLLLGLLRIKFVALLIGPTGVGLIGIFHAIQNIAATASGMGINSSGVREVAEATGKECNEHISRTVLTLRRLCWLTGLIGAILLITLAAPISKLSFGSTEYTGQVMCLAISVFLGSIAAGQMALLQGTRRIGDLARVNIISSLSATAAAIGFYYWLGLKGIIPAIIMISVTMLISSFWYSRKVKIDRVDMTWLETITSAKSLILLGVVFMTTALMTGLVDYVTISLISNYINLVSVGIYAAAYRLSGLFLNFILNAMGADFYPQLTAASSCHKKMGSLVNYQTEIGLLLAVPGLLATLILAPWLITVFYTQAFAESAHLVQWLILGCLGRVVSWPMGYIMLAKGVGRVYLVTETISHIAHLCLIWVGLHWLGLKGVAIAFCALNILYPIAVMRVSRNLIAFKWTKSVKKLLCIFSPLLVGAMFLSSYCTLLVSTIVGCIIIAVVGIYCLRELCSRLGANHKLVVKLQMIPGVNMVIGT